MNDHPLYARIVALALGAILATSAAAEAQTSQGPASGTSASAGDLVNTGSFSAFPFRIPILRPRAPKHTVPLAADPPFLPPGLGPVGSNEQDDLGRLLGPLPIALRVPSSTTDFQGLTFTGFIPPDPTLAAGPNHLMPLVNSDFAIFDKTGNNLQQIDAATWYNGVQPGNNAFDPKVIYDHFANRWVMVWLSSDFFKQSVILISVSDDSDPNGAWCNWSIRGDLNGSTPSNNASDYHGLGYDQNAVYVVPNQFNFGTGAFDYAKIRILPKTDLYDDTCPVLNWFDFWDLRDPGTPTQVVFTTRPAVTYGTPSVYYLINDSPFVTGNHMTVWQIADPVGTPVLSGSNVPTTTRFSPPDAGQLNPPPTPIDVGGPRIRNVFYRNNRLWTAHSVADATPGVFARARYVRFDVSGAPVADQDISFGADGCWLYYPAVAADQNDNLVMVYTQSCTNEYASVYFTGRTTTEGTLQPGQVLQAGVAKYELVGGGRNRWGDYSGIAVDPVDQNRIWIHGEFAAAPTVIDQWQTWVGEIISRGLGDVNDDGQVNVADLTLLTEYVLEITPAPTPPSLDFIASDCASDGVLNIGDIVCVVDLILNPSGPALAAGAVPIGAINPSRVRLNLAEADAARAVGESRAYSLDADIGPGIAAFQMRIAYDPMRVRIGTPRAVERASSFTVASNDTGDELIIIGYSMDGRLLDPGEGPIVSLPVDELRASGPGDEPALELTEVMFSDRAGGVAYASVGQATLAKPPPLVLKLGEPYPNPVGLQGTRIDLEIPVGIAPNLSGAGAASGGGTIRVLAEVYNVRGQLVRRVLDEPLLPGRHAIEWDGRSENGAAVSAGLYVMRVIAGTLNETRKLIVSSRSRD